MNAVTFAAAVLARLQDQLTVPVIDGEPIATPAGNYCHASFDGGLGSRENLAYTDRRDFQVWIVCVGLDHTGARWVADKVTDALTDHSPDGNHPLVPVVTGPALTDGPAGDRRTSITVAFALPTWRS